MSPMSNGIQVPRRRRWGGAPPSRAPSIPSKTFGAVAATGMATGTIGTLPGVTGMATGGIAALAGTGIAIGAAGGVDAACGAATATGGIGRTGVLTGAGGAGLIDFEGGGGVGAA